MKLDLKLEGEREIKQELRRLEKLYPDAMGAALYQEGLSLWRAAVKRAPVEFGVLRNSAYVSPPMKDGPTIGVEAGFGTKYAVYQEEGEGYHHPRGGEAHYFGKSVEEAKSGYLERLAQRTKQNAESGVKAPVISAPTSPQSASRRRLRRIRRRR